MLAPVDAPNDPLAPLLADALHPAYLLVRQLGEGGMGAVYLARDPALKRDVAVKVLRPDLARDAVARTRFEREAESVAAISHPNVINIYTVGQMPDGTPYFVMQFATGRSLELRLERDGPLPVSETRRIMGEVASALATAHKRGIIHRDIKPANVLQDEASGRVIVTDFGIAAVQQADPTAARLTEAGMSPGTPHYMSPEQLLNEDATDRTDVYSLGVLGYELLTGAGPFRATSPHEVAAAHLRDTPAPVSQTRPDVDADLEQLIGACLAKNPTDRPAAEAIAQRLLPGSGVLLEWPPPGLERIAGRWAWVNRRLGLGCGLVMAGMLGMILADPGEAPLLPNGLLAATALLGCLTIVGVIFGAFRLLGAARRAVRRGYAWSTVAEAAADVRGDTGALITGSRDYALHLPAVRRRLRTWRVVRAACTFGAAALPVPSLLLAIRSGLSTAASPAWLVVVTLLPALLLIDVAWLLRLLENRVVHRPHTRKRRGPAPAFAAANVVAAWNASLDATRAGALASGLAPFRLGRAVAGLTLLAVLVAAAVLTPLMVLNPVVDVLSSVARPRFAASRSKVYPAMAGATWAPPVDSAITPREAGDAIHALVSLGRPQPPDYRPPVARLSQPFLRDTAGNPFGSNLGQMQDSLLRLGQRRAFSQAQQRYLRDIAANPGWAMFRTAARAPRADIIAARYAPAALEVRNRGLVWSYLTLPQYKPVRDAGLASAAVAALRLSEGRPADAEAALRDAVGIGLRLINDGTILLETMQGAQIVNNAMDRLATFYEITGRGPEARRIRDSRDSARARADQESDLERALGERFNGNPTVQVRNLLMRMVADTTLPASFRWEFVRMTVAQPCIDAHELVFGARPEVESTLARFARQVLRTPGDSAFLQMLTADTASLGKSIPSLLYGRSHVGACLTFMARTF